MAVGCVLLAARRAKEHGSDRTETCAHLQPKDRQFNPYEDVKPLIEDLDGGDVDAGGDLGNLRHYAKYAGDDGSASGEGDGGDSPGSGDDDDDDEEEFAPAAAGGSRAPAAASGKLVPNDRGILPGEEEIGSDLDDPDSEDEERDDDEEDEGDGLEEMDLKENVVFCSYDKVGPQSSEERSRASGIRADVAFRFKSRSSA